MKIAKIKFFSLKEKNSSRFNHRDSNSFSFLTLHALNFLTHFPEGGRSSAGTNFIDDCLSLQSERPLFIKAGIEMKP